MVGLRSLVEKVDETKIEDTVKKATNKADILSLIIKIEQGKGSVSDVLNVTKKGLQGIRSESFRQAYRCSQKYVGYPIPL